MDLKALIEELEKQDMQDRDIQNAADSVVEMARDMRALHGIDAAQELANGMAHAKGLGDEFAKAVMDRLRSEGTSRSIFRPTSIPNEWSPAIAALEGFMRSIAAYFEWLDEILLGHMRLVWHDYAVGEAVDITTTRELIVTLEPCSAEFFARMEIEEKAPLAVDAFVGKRGVRIFVDLKTMPRYFGDWLGHWVQARAYEKNYIEQGWGIHDNHIAPRTFDYTFEATNMYSSARLERTNPLKQLVGVGVEPNPQGKELIEWVDNKLTPGAQENSSVPPK